ncbi:MAG TPA: hypothetical protein DCW72_00450 [Elusimicrobia bacterium]|nr:MAG: hypothetical protein A2X30_03230 [Elusimicrobia bacterium GWB2_63_16]HAU88743.1 hypothetical protein [Elusimicrobiota bacterium]
MYNSSMKIVAGVVSPREAEYFSEFAEELYFGVPQVENHRKWYANQQFASTAEVKTAVRAAHAMGRRILLAANEIYRPAAYAGVLASIRRLLDLGVDGLIVRDLFLLDHFTSREPGPKLVLSSTAGCFNAEAARFYARFRLARIVVPQHVLPAEFSPVLRQVRGPAYEIFYFPDCFCPNVDGVCPLHDINKTESPRNCTAPHALAGRSWRMPKPPWAARLEMIRDYYRLGVRHIKMPRDGTFEEKRSVLRSVLRISEALRAGVSRKEFLRRASEEA